MKRLIFLFVVGIYMFSFLNLALGDSYTSIHYTGFESGVDGWSDPGSDADRQLEGSGDEDPPSQCDDFGNCNDNGQYTFHIQDDSATSYTEQSFNFNSYDYIILNFWGYPSDWNGGEYVQINCDGNEIWRETQGDYSNEVWRFVSIMIYPDNCTFDSSVIIRFTGDPGLSGDGDDWVFDGINITGAMIEVGDIVYPNVASLLPLQGEGFNQSEEIEISANVSDDILVDSVYANITLPNGTINQIKLINHTLNKYNSSFMIPSIGGRYYFKIITNDSSNNINDTEESYFEVEDNLTFLNFVGYGYLDGERNNLFYEGNIGALVLDNSNEGNFTSQVFDAGSSVDWKNMSWVQDSAFSESKLIKPIYAESEFGVDITSQVESSDGTATWERVEVQAWNDSLSEGVIDSVIGYCEVEWIDAGAQIGFQISRNNGSSWDSEICVQDTVALTIFSCDLKANSGVDTIEEVNNLRMRCTFPTAGSGDYYSTDYVYVEINYSNSELNFQVRSDDDDSAWGDFIGPDGTSSSYYTNSSLSELNVSDNRYFQYKAFFSESNQLYNVSISYSDICTANITNTSWSEWGNLTCVLDEMNQTRFLTEYDSNNCGAANITIYDYQLVGPSLYNTTWSNWENITLCLPGDYYTQERNLTQYDAYSCKLNETISEQQNLTCDFCVPNMVNTTWSDWINLTCAGDQMNQSRYFIEYDSNNCEEISNQTYYDYQLIGPDLYNTSWSEWTNISCLVDDTMNQTRNRIEYDAYSCSINITIIEYRNTEFCDFCTPNLINTSWTEWTNTSSCYANDTIEQSRNLTEYDLNDCGEISNSTIFEYQISSCDFCTPNLINTSWTEWTNLTCSREQMNQSRYFVEYDSNSCGEISNQTYSEYQLVGPALYNTTWSNWENITLCLPGDYYTQERNLTQYDAYSCKLNETISEQQNLTCDYNGHPMIMIESPLSQIYDANLILFNATSSEEVDTWIVNYNGTNITGINFSLVLSDGNYNLFIWANDTLGNLGVASVNFSVDTIYPEILILYPENKTYDFFDFGMNYSYYDQNPDSCWYSIDGGATNISIICGENITTLQAVEGTNLLTLYINDSTGKENYTLVEFNVKNFTLLCEAGGPYQQGALVLVQGEARNGTSGLYNLNVNSSILKNNLVNLSEILTTSSDGSFESSIYNLDTGNYILNVSAQYEGFNRTCTDSFGVGSPAIIILDKYAEVYEINNYNIIYNISLRLLNIGGAFSINSNISDIFNYTLGTLVAGESKLESYLINITRQNTTNYYFLRPAEAQAVDSYSNTLISAYSTSLNLTIPATAFGKQIAILKNVIYASDTILNITYNVTSTLYNIGDEDLYDITYIDNDIFLTSALINLSRGRTSHYSNLVIINKASSNTYHQFALGTATVDSQTFYSNRPSILIPGYGGPADAIVYSPSSVLPDYSFDSIIEVKNMNLDIGQDFVIDYWITNNAETTNYSSGQQTIYVAANRSSNLTVNLNSPSLAGDYRLRALVSWIVGTASSYDSFEVTEIGDDDSGDDSGGDDGGGGGGGVILPNRTVQENQTEDEQPIEEIPEIPEEPEENLTRGRGFTGLFIEGDTGSITFIGKLVGWLLLLLVLLYIIYRLIRGLLARRKKKRPVGRLSSLINMLVYTLGGMELGKVKDIILEDIKIYSLRIKLSKKLKVKIKGIDLRYKHVKGIKDVIVVDEEVLDEIKKQEDERRDMVIRVKDEKKSRKKN